MVDVAANVEREIFLEFVHVCQVAALACLGKRVEGCVRPGNVCLVVLVVVQLHDLAADMRLKRGVIVGQFGKSVRRHRVLHSWGVFNLKLSRVGA